MYPPSFSGFIITVTLIYRKCVCAISKHASNNQCASDSGEVWLQLFLSPSKTRIPFLIFYALTSFTYSFNLIPNFLCISLTSYTHLNMYFGDN